MARGLVELRGLLGGAGDGGRAFSGGLPGAGCEDGFAVDGHPRGELGYDSELFGIGLAAGGQRDVEHEVSVAGDDVDELIDDLLGRFVFLAELVVPLADAGVGLPGARIDFVDDSALAIEDADAGGCVFAALGEVDGFGFAIVVRLAGARGPDVVEVGDEVVSVVLEGQRAVGVEEVGLAVVDEVFDALEPLLLPPEGDVGLVPLGPADAAPDLVGCDVEVGVRGIGSVVGNVGERASCVAAVAGREPFIGYPEMLGDAEAQALGAGGVAPESDDVFAGAHLCGVPALVAGVP